MLLTAKYVFSSLKAKEETTPAKSVTLAVLFKFSLKIIRLVLGDVTDIPAKAKHPLLFVSVTEMRVIL